MDLRESLAANFLRLLLSLFFSPFPPLSYVGLLNIYLRRPEGGRRTWLHGECQPREGRDNAARERRTEG